MTTCVSQLHRIQQALTGFQYMFNSQGLLARLSNRFIDNLYKIYIALPSALGEAPSLLRNLVVPISSPLDLTWGYVHVKRKPCPASECGS